MSHSKWPAYMLALSKKAGSTRAAADCIGVHWSMPYKWLNGTGLPSAGTVERIAKAAKALGLPPPPPSGTRGRPWKHRVAPVQAIVNADQNGHGTPVASFSEAVATLRQEVLDELRKSLRREAGL